MNRALILASLAIMVGARFTLWAGPPPAAKPPGAAQLAKLASRHLPNGYRLNEKVMSGGQPDGEAAFAELRSLGVKTIISVDGAQPDVAMAKKYGLRYVHLPHGYDGIPARRLQELAKAVRDLPGPIYIHCHHGKHRSPAAAAAACISVGMLDNAAALGVLKTAGTSPNYRGLYDTVATAQKLAPDVLDKLPVDFRASVEGPPLVDAMVAIEHNHDRLKAMDAAGWKALADHPDLDAAHEALLLKEQFTELLRTDDVQKQPQKFGDLMRTGNEAAGQLEAVLRAASRNAKRAAAAFAKVSANCQACHQAFRDVPLGEKLPAGASEQ